MEASKSFWHGIVFSFLLAAPGVEAVEMPFVACSDSTLQEDEIRFLPETATAGQKVRVELLGNRPSSPVPIYTVDIAIHSSQITATAVVGDLIGFSVGGSYCVAASIGGLPPATYSATYLVESTIDQGATVTPARVAATAQLAVLGVDAAPTLNTFLAIALAGMVVGAAAVTLRRKESLR